LINQKLLQPVLDAFVACGVQDIFIKKAILANMQKECGLVPKEENLNYSNTSNDRIRKIFGSRVSKYTDTELDNIKKYPEKFAEVIYGHETNIGKGMGNINPGDGWTYRGRGYIQLTGRNNYKFYGDLTGFNLIANPELLITDPNISAMVSVKYIQIGLGRSSFTDQKTANREVTQIIAGRSLNLDKGYGAELLEIVNKYSENIQI
jgi:putative chitinase